MSATLTRPASTGAASAGARRHLVTRPKVAVDIVLFAIEGELLKCYLVQLKVGLAEGRWAFPGGLVRVGELLDDAARRELQASTGLIEPYVEQLFTFGDPTRDPRTHVVSVAYMGLIDDPAPLKSCSRKYTTGRWLEVSGLPPLAYDHS